MNVVENICFIKGKAALKCSYGVLPYHGSMEVLHPNRAKQKGSKLHQPLPNFIVYFIILKLNSFTDSSNQIREFVSRQEIP